MGRKGAVGNTNFCGLIASNLVAAEAACPSLQTTKGNEISVVIMETLSFEKVAGSVVSAIIVCCYGGVFPKRESFTRSSGGCVVLLLRTWNTGVVQGVGFSP